MPNTSIRLGTFYFKKLRQIIIRLVGDETYYCLAFFKKRETISFLYGELATGHHQFFLSNLVILRGNDEGVA